MENNGNKLMKLINHKTQQQEALTGTKEQLSKSSSSDRAAVWEMMARWRVFAEVNGGEGMSLENQSKLGKGRGRERDFLPGKL